jgi:hypothetical protein
MASLLLSQPTHRFGDRPRDAWRQFYLMMKRAGHVFGLDGWAANLHVVRNNALLLGGRLRRDD